MSLAATIHAMRVDAARRHVRRVAALHGIPPASAERILGAQLAAGRDVADARNAATSAIHDTTGVTR